MVSSAACAPPPWIGSGHPILIVSPCNPRDFRPSHHRYGKHPQDANRAVLGCRSRHPRGSIRRLYIAVQMFHKIVHHVDWRRPLRELPASVRPHPVQPSNRVGLNLRLLRTASRETQVVGVFVVAATALAAPPGREGGRPGTLRRTNFSCPGKSRLCDGSSRRSLFAWLAARSFDAP